MNKGRYAHVCCATTLKGKRCTKTRIYTSPGELSNFCLIHNPIEKITCSICLEDIKKGKTQKLINCAHIFCFTCINEWLLRNESCPCCRNKIDVVEKQICTNYGIGVNKIININFITHSFENIEIGEKLTFFEYSDIFYKCNIYYTSDQWSEFINYIKSNDTVYKIFIKSKKIISTNLIKKHDIEQYMQRINNNFKITNNMILFKLKD